MVQQDVALLGDFVEQGLGFLECVRVLLAVWFEFEVGAVEHVGHGHQPNEVYGAVHLIELVCGQPELVEQKTADVVGALVGDFQPHAVAEIAVAQFVLDGGAQVAYVVFVQRKLAVAGEAELVAAFHIHAAEKFVHIFV